MKSYFPLFLFVVVISTVSCTGSGSEEEYDTVEYDDLELEFSIYAALQNYTTWIKERNLDPSPPFQGESRMYSKGLDFEVELIIRNQKVTGHSKLRPVSFNDTVINLEDHFLTVSLTHSVTICSGDYSASGRIFGDVRFNKTGTFTTTLSFKHALKEKLRYDTYGLTENDKYINLSSTRHISYYFGPVQFEDVSFNETDLHISASGHYSSVLLNEVKDRLSTLYMNYFTSHYDEHPSGILLHRYLEEVLLVTPLFDKIPIVSSSEHTGPEASQEEIESSDVVTFKADVDDKETRVNDYGALKDILSLW